MFAFETGQVFAAGTGQVFAVETKFAKHIGVSDNQPSLGVLESVFFFLFRPMASPLAGRFGGGILQVLKGTSPLFFGFLKMIKNATSLKRNAHF